MSTIRHAGALLLAASLFTGCAGAPHAKMVGGGVLATAGVVIAAHRADGHCSDDGPGEDHLCDRLVSDPINAGTDVITTMLGVGLIVLGGGLIVSGIRESDAQHSDVPLTALVPVVAEPGPPGANVHQDARVAEPLPAELVVRARIENRLALQASLAARRGHCSAAVLTANALAARDPDLQAKLVAADVNLQACYATTAAQRM